jgi:hypothetical protein
MPSSPVLPLNPAVCLHVPGSVCLFCTPRAQRQEGLQFRWFLGEGEIDEAALGAYIGKTPNKALRHSLTLLKDVQIMQKEARAKVGGASWAPGLSR